MCGRERETLRDPSLPRDFLRFSFSALSVQPHINAPLCWKMLRSSTAHLFAILACAEAAGSMSSSSSTQSSPPPPPAAASPPPAPVTLAPITTRFVFADGEGGTGEWSAQTTTVAKYATPRSCPKGGFVAFNWAPGTHDIMLMKSKAHLDSCDFTGATSLAPAGSGSDIGMESFYYDCTTPGSVYLSCSIPGHCAAGQKLEVVTSSSASVFGPSGEVLLHSRSLKQVMTLLNAPAMNTGYQTEAQAHHTLEAIWCLEDHCPDSASDWQADATKASCRADVHNLAGFVSRKKPQADFAKARTYYDEALAFDPNHCPTLAYLTELNVQTSNASGAAATAGLVCTACGSGSAYAKEALAALQGASIGAPASCATGPSGAVLGGGIGGGVAALVALVALLAKLRSRRSVPAAVGGAIKGKQQPVKVASATLEEGRMEVAPTPPSLPPSPPTSASERSKLPYVV